MSQLVNRGKRAPGQPVVRVQEDTRSDFGVVGEKTRDPGGKRTHVDAHTELEFKQALDVANGRQTQADALAEFERIALGLDPDVSRQERTFSWIVARPLDAEEILEFYLSADEPDEDLSRFAGFRAAVSTVLPEPGRKVHMH